MAVGPDNDAPAVGVDPGGLGEQDSRRWRNSTAHTSETGSRSRRATNRSSRSSGALNRDRRTRTVRVTTDGRAIPVELPCSCTLLVHHQGIEGRSPPLRRLGRQLIRPRPHRSKPTPARSADPRRVPSGRPGRSLPGSRRKSPGVVARYGGDCRPVTDMGEFREAVTAWAAVATAIPYASSQTDCRSCAASWARRRDARSTTAVCSSRPSNPTASPLHWKTCSPVSERCRRPISSGAAASPPERPLPVREPAAREGARWGRRAVAPRRPAASRSCSTSPRPARSWR